MFRKRKKRKYFDVNPDEIFLDSKNLPEFNVQQFEGRLEKAIPKRSLFYLGGFFVLIGIIFLYQLGTLQVLKGTYYLKKSENNTLSQEPIFSDRGMIVDRNQVKLAWNIWSEDNTDRFDIPVRAYINEGGFGHLLGYVSYPQKDSSGNYWQSSFVGKDGTEKVYNDKLKGENGVRITEVDVKNTIQSENIITPPKHGDNVVLSIDKGIQSQMYKSIVDMAKNVGFSGGAGAVMDLTTGELLAITSYPEYNPNILSKGSDTAVIKGYLTDKRKVFLNRAIGGLYAPGSIVKPFIGYAALVEGVITPFKNILSNGKLEIQNPYAKDQKTVFNDHGIFGYVNMSKAIAVSSDVYFYQIGGGYMDQKGLGIVNIDKYIKIFGISNKTGIDLLGEKEGNVPTPEWKAKTFNGDDWRLGDTYNTAIGQYGLQVTLIQMVRAVSAIATMGRMPTPHILFRDDSMESKVEKINIDPEMMKVVQAGMREAVVSGTATALNIPGVAVAAKSGTAQVGVGNTNTNSWIIGYFPYENPKYAFAVLMERGPKSASGNATRVMSEVVDYIKVSAPQYLQ